MAGVRSVAAGAGQAETPDPGHRSGPLRPVPSDPWSTRRAARRSRCDRLSAKERAVLTELACGNSTEEIGLILSVSPHTVRTHVKNLMRKLDARTRAHAVAIALSERAIDVSP